MRYTKNKADRFIAENKDGVDKTFRPLFHFAPPVGWINDPNGLVFYKGKYHIFYQYYPYKTRWGPMHWGHAESVDLVKFKDLPIALAPDLFNESGCYSGGAVVTPKDELVLFYTKHRNRIGKALETQGVAISKDGINFEKSRKAVISLPLGIKSNDFRDPNPVIIDGVYYIFIAAKTKKKRAQIMVYKSEDLKDFKLFTSIALDEFKNMPECPDFFILDGKCVLIASVINTLAENEKKNSCIYIIGRFDTKKGEFKAEKIEEIDGGDSFYAPQTLIDDKGRRIMIAWQSNWQDEYFLDKNGHGWNGCLTFPRQLSVVNNSLVQTPIEEIRLYYKDKIEVNGLSFVPNALDMSMTMANDSFVRFENPKNERDFFEIGIFDNRVYFDGKSIVLNPVKRAVSKLLTPKECKMRVLLDKCGVEIFIDDGMDVISSMVFIDCENYKISTKGKVALKEIWSIIDEKAGKNE